MTKILDFIKGSGYSECKYVDQIWGVIWDGFKFPNSACTVGANIRVIFSGFAHITVQSEEILGSLSALLSKVTQNGKKAF